MKRKCLPIATAIDATLKLIREREYSPKTVKHYENMFRQFARYAHDHRRYHVTPSLIESFCSYKKPLLAANSQTWVDSTMRRMLDAIEGKYILGKIRRSWRTSEQLERELALLDEFTKENLGWSKSTRIQRIYWMRRFLASLPPCKRTVKWDKLRPVDISNFLRTLPRKAVPARLQAIRGLSAIFRVLFCMGRMSTSLYASIRIPCRLPRKSPALWAKEDALRLMASIDRSQSPGRRDYAILLLAYHLGIRAGDIRTLRLDSLLWEEEIIDFIQKKTGRRIRLPLLPEVGSAIIDYLRHERPTSDAPEVFLRHRAPITPFNFMRNFNEMLILRGLNAGIPRERIIGFHGFRRALATRLLKANHPLPTIAACLGHIDVNTTRRYLANSTDMLREVCIDPESEVASA